MKKFLRRLVVEEDGPTAVEYAVMLALIIVVCVGAVGSLGLAVAANFNDSNDKLTAAWN
jgi:pilus assembly protein Flp/PilA